MMTARKAVECYSQPQGATGGWARCSGTIPDCFSGRGPQGGKQSSCLRQIYFQSQVCFALILIPPVKVRAVCSDVGHIWIII